jgi:hypothetical protein
MFLYNNLLAQIHNILYNSTMPFKMWKNGVKLFLFTFFILSLIGSSVISAGEAFGNEYSNNDNLNSGTYYSSIGHNIEWLARFSLKKDSGNYSHMRNNLFRVFTFAGIIAMAIYLMKVNLKNKNNKIQTKKNFILLKLRI